MSEIVSTGTGSAVHQSDAPPPVATRSREPDPPAVENGRHNDRDRRGRWTGVSRGDHREFVELFDLYLDAMYPAGPGERPGAGRWRLTRSLATEIMVREATTVLDCAAGTGFPALELVADRNHNLTVHCTDGDSAMLRALRRRANRLNIPFLALFPNRADNDPHQSIDPLLLSWEDLGSIRGTYDYVMCRGNSLAYANTWTGSDETAPHGQVADYLANMAAKVRRGGHLHVDAPWTMELAEKEHLSGGTERCTIWEQVTPEPDGRRWDLAYKFKVGRTVRFRRFSSLLTIHDVKSMLDDLGFENTQPMELPAERPGFGVIIARRPER